MVLAQMELDKVNTHLSDPKYTAKTDTVLSTKPDFFFIFMDCKLNNHLLNFIFT